MPATFSAGTIRVFTFKDGVLARFAHDLRLTVARFAVTLDGRDVRATFDPRSLTVDGVVKGPRVDEKLLSAKDRADIQANLEEHVLKWRQHPEVTYAGRLASSQGGKLTVKGALTLVGREGPLDLTLERRGANLVGTATILQTRWGIQPFVAMMGAIKIKNQLEVRLELPIPEAATEVA